MKAVVRNIVTLAASAVAMLVLLGTLLYLWHLESTHHAQFSADFLFPAQTDLAQARASLTELRVSLHSHAAPAAAPGATIARLNTLRELRNIEDHLMAVGRLTTQFEFRPAYDLPARALEQFRAVHERLKGRAAPDHDEVHEILASVGPLHNTLMQLEQILEIESRRLAERRHGAETSSVRLTLIAVVLLMIAAAALTARLTADLRSSILREVRARQDLEEAQRGLERLALQDSLTGLGNRNLFRARLDHAIQAARRSGQVSGLLYIDLDNFKRINDSLGHDAGDRILEVVAARLAGAVRESDTVARLGGDEFTVILSDVGGAGSVRSIAGKLLERIRTPVRIPDMDVVLTASIGVALLPGDGDEPGLLMKNADMALYKAKDDGRNTIRFFDESMHRAMVGKMAMERDLRAAIRDRSFALHYQPQFDLASGKACGMEALLRWRREDGTTVPPHEFLEVADEAGLLVDIGAWVILQACTDLAMAQSRWAKDLRVSVNLSARQFQDPDLEKRIAAGLAANGLEPSALEVEITETTLIADIEAASRTLRTLRDLGVSVAIDDFGVGYSSLNYLKHLPIDALKIDRSFVRDIESDEADRSIVDAVLAMAHSLGLRVVAEGIENEFQRSYLAARGCNVGQGYLLSRPAPIEALLDEHGWPGTGPAARSGPTGLRAV